MSLYHNGKSAHRQYDDGVHLFLKKRGETLSVLLERFRAELAIPKDVPLTYAGRLDPMADGLMIILSGEACKEKETYSALPKQYRFKVLFGIETDTYDALGKITNSAFPELVTKEQVQEALNTLKEKTAWEYPPYASRTVDGVPLFAHARGGTLPEHMPIKEGTIEELTLNTLTHVPLQSIQEEAMEAIGKVTGDFRQEEIRALWRTLPEDQSVYIAECEAVVSSGVYIRSIAHELGKMLSIPALAYSITRTQIGEHRLT